MEREGGYGTNNGKPFLGGGGGGGRGGFHTLTEHKYEKFEKEYPGRTHILGQHVPIDFLQPFYYSIIAIVV